MHKVVLFLVSILALSACEQNEQKTLVTKDTVITEEITVPPVQHIQTINESMLIGCNSDTVCFNILYERKPEEKLLINVSFNNKTGDAMIYKDDINGEIKFVLHAKGPILDMGGEISYLQDGHYLMVIQRPDLSAKVGIDIVTL